MKFKLYRTQKYVNYIIIGVSMIPYFALSFDYVANNIDTLKYYYPVIPLTFSTYFIGVTFLATKLTDKLYSLSANNNKHLLNEKQCDKIRKQ